MSSPLVQVIFIDGNEYFSEHKPVEWEIHSIFPIQPAHLDNFRIQKKLSLIPILVPMIIVATAKLISPALNIPDCDNNYVLYDSDVMQMVLILRPEVRAIYLKLHTTDS